MPSNRQTQAKSVHVTELKPGKPERRGCFPESTFNFFKLYYMYVRKEMAEVCSGLFLNTSLSGF